MSYIQIMFSLNEIQGILIIMSQNNTWVLWLKTSEKGGEESEMWHVCTPVKGQQLERTGKDGDLLWLLLSMEILNEMK